MGVRVLRRDRSSARSADRERTEFLVTDRHLSAVVLAACGFVIVVGLGRSLLGLASFTSTDLLGQLAPWAAYADPALKPHNPYVGDPVGSIFPAFHEIVSRLWHCDYPAWSSLQSGGAELGSVPIFGMLTPIWLPFLVLPLWLAPAYAQLIELLIAIAGMYAFTRRLGLCRSAGWFGGLAFATSGFLIAWTNWPQARTAAMIPTVFWALERLLQERTGRSVGLVSVAIAVLIASGFPSVAAYALYTAAVYVLVRVLFTTGINARIADGLRRAAASASLMAAGVLLGVILMAVQLLPFVHLLGQTFAGDRLQEPDDFLPLASLVTMISPDALGTPATHASWLGPRNPIESFSYLGVAVVVLACIGVVAGFAERTVLVRHRAARLAATSGSTPIERFSLRAFFLLTAVVWGVAIYAGGDLLAHLQQLPTISTNAIGRARSVVGFLIAVLAAAGFDALVRRRGVVPELGTANSRWRRISQPPVLANALVILAGTVAFGTAAAELIRHGDTFASVEGFARSYHRHVGVAVILGLLTLTTACGRWGSKRWRLVALALVPIMVAIQAATVVAVWWPQVPRADVYPVTGSTTFSQRTSATTGTCRSRRRCCPARACSTGYARSPGTRSCVRTSPISSAQWIQTRSSHRRCRSPASLPPLARDDCSTVWPCVIWSRRRKCRSSATAKTMWSPAQPFDGSRARRCV